MYNWASHSTLRNAKFRFGEAAKPPLGKLRAAKPKHFGAAKLHTVRARWTKRASPALYQ